MMATLVLGAEPKLDVFKEENDDLEEDLGVLKPLPAPASFLPVNLDYPTMHHASCFLTSSQHEKAQRWIK